MAAGRFPIDDFRFKSEAFVPIRQDSQSFEERQKRIWEDMHERMERRRREWDDEVTRLRKDFFRLRPDDDMPALRGTGTIGPDSLLSAGAPLGALTGGNDRASSVDATSNVFYDSPDGTGNGKVFRVSFDVSQFQPEEISVRTQDQHLIVHAKHEEKGGDKSVSREFSRQIDIPANVDPQTLRSTLSKDGILQVEAPVAAPAYDRIRSIGGSASPVVGGGLFYPGSADPAVLQQQTGLSGSGGSQQRSVITSSDAHKSGFRIAVDIGADFEPGDLTVKTVDKKLIVHARHEEKAPGRTSCREFNREFDLPDGIDPQSVTASLGEDGRLVIEAPTPAAP